MLRAGLSPRTTNMPGEEYMAARIFTFAAGRPMPLTASCRGSPVTSAMSRLPASMRGRFSVLPLVLRVCTRSEASASLTVSAKAAP